jgi:hypothetical protein
VEAFAMLNLEDIVVARRADEVDPHEEVLRVSLRFEGLSVIRHHDRSVRDSMVDRETSRLVAAIYGKFLGLLSIEV